MLCILFNIKAPFVLLLKSPLPWTNTFWPLTVQWGSYTTPPVPRSTSLSGCLSDTVDIAYVCHSFCYGSVFTDEKRSLQEQTTFPSSHSLQNKMLCLKQTLGLNLKRVLPCRPCYSLYSHLSEVTTKRRSKCRRTLEGDMKATWRPHSHK